ncbi:hypothetical protein BJ508DRAFT_327624 [Ascobolus immersus RN42]|uniref:Uncharacterized protein n=1 Tax=Ascobolus immersus RN42 TaxID=1160509 RepID=A0A3N4I624_ASCIM|nr:hypothetical protein BJ508DRAFT_327624 [Ascobolus immersus RN42]
MVLSFAHIFSGIPANSTLTWYQCPYPYAQFNCARLLIPVNHGRGLYSLSSNNLVKLPAFVPETDASWAGHVRLPYHYRNRTIWDSHYPDEHELVYVFKHGEYFRNLTGGKYTLIAMEDTPNCGFDEQVEPETQLVNLRKPLPTFLDAYDRPLLLGKVNLRRDSWFPNLGNFSDYSYEWRSHVEDRDPDEM